MAIKPHKNSLEIDCSMLALLAFSIYFLPVTLPSSYTPFYDLMKYYS